MRAVVFAEPGRIEIEDVPVPKLAAADEAIVKVHKTSICASDLHLIHGKTPGMRPGAVIGHEYVGSIASVGDEVLEMQEGTRVLGSFLIACGSCDRCKARRFNHCTSRRALGLGTLTGDLDGAQAEYVRVPAANVNLKPMTGALSGVSEEAALFGGDILATGFYAAHLAEPGPDSLVAIVGAGPIGLLSAAAMPAPARVVMLDVDPNRARFAGSLGFESVVVGDDPGAALEELTGARADICVEAVGSVQAFKAALHCVRDGGRIAVIGVYGTERYDLHMGMAWIRGLEVRFGGMANVQAHWDDALMNVAKGTVDPRRLITHRLPLADALKGYEMFAAREAVKVVLEV